MGKQLPLLGCYQVLWLNSQKLWILESLSHLWPVTNQLHKGMILPGTKFETQRVVLLLHLTSTGTYLDTSNKHKSSCLFFFSFEWWNFHVYSFSVFFDLWTLKIFKLQNCLALVRKLNPLLSVTCHVPSTTHLPIGNAQQCITHSTEKPGNIHYNQLAYMQ